MHLLSFYHHGEWHGGSLLTCGAEAPEFYWYFLDGDEIRHQLGDCIPFTWQDEKIVPMKSYGEEYAGLIESIKEVIQPLCKLS